MVITVTDATGSGSSGSLKIFDFVQASVTPLGCRQNYTAFAEGVALTIANRAHADYTSAFTGELVPAEVAGFNDVISISARDNVFDSQRRRK